MQRKRGGSAPDTGISQWQGHATGLEITTTHSSMAVRLTEYRPTIVIDGTQQTKWLWGPRFFPLDPGRHHVEIYVRYFLMKSGRAELDVDLAPGQIRRISYRFPFVIFQRGRITEV